MRWRPNICPDPSRGCILEWASGSMWGPDEPWQFVRVCPAHERATKQETLAALKDENQRMSYARERLRQGLGLPEDDASIAFRFDATRRLILTVPVAARGALAANLATIAAAVRQVDPDVTIE